MPAAAQPKSVLIDDALAPEPAPTEQIGDRIGWLHHPEPTQHQHRTGPPAGQFPRAAASPSLGPIAFLGECVGVASWDRLDPVHAATKDFLHGFVPDQMRYCGGRMEHPQRQSWRGGPLAGTSWLNRPAHVGWLVGGIFADDVISGQLGQDNDIFGGYRVGYDFDHYWGAEFRFAFANPALIGAAAPVGRDSRLLFYDAHLAYYPWGDTQWRPYLSAGLGAANVRATDAAGIGYNELLFHVPIGIGLKHHWRRWCVLRADLHDNIAIGAGGIDTMHNVTFTFGVEVHSGGQPTSYYPWNPSRHLW